MAIGMIAGIVVGILAQNTPIVTDITKFLGDIFIRLIRMVVVPLVFATLVAGAAGISDTAKLGRVAVKTMLYYLLTTMASVAIGLLLANIMHPGAGLNLSTEGLQAKQVTPPALSDTMMNLIPINPVEAMAKGNMLQIIIFAIIFGFCVSACGGDESPMGKLLNNLNDIIMKFVGVIMFVAPLGLGAYFANLVATYGPEIVGDYGRSMLVYYPLCALYFIIFFPLYAFLAGGKQGVKVMFKHIFRPAITAFATQSSAATIPVNKEACNSIGVPEDISDLVLPMGCTMHMDGSVLSSIVKIAFLYGIFGMDFTGVDTYAMAIIVAILSAFVLSGAPGGGLVGEMLIVSMFNFPAEAFPIIATLGFIFDPAATCLNSSGDTIASMMVTRIVEGKDWLVKAIAAKKAEQA